MLIRIVKLTFKEDKVPVFLNHFEQVKERIRNFPGCQFLELYQDKEQAQVFFTYSYWNAEEDLENYKNSETFGEIWPFVKTLFEERPLAWSVHKMASLP